MNGGATAQPQTAATLGRKLDEITSALDRDIAQIAQQIDSPLHFDIAQVTMALARITQLSHAFIQLLPMIGAARAHKNENNGTLDSAEARQWGDLDTHIYRCRTGISQWPHIEKLVRGQIPPKRRKLYTKPDAVTVARLAASDAVFDDLHAMLNTADQSTAARDHGCFADISLPHSTFMAHLHAARRVTLAQKLRHPPRFLDVGCGGGMKVLSARQCFERAEGLEFDPGYVLEAQQLFDRSKTGACQVIHADGLTYDDYDRFDVIYFYRPMRDTEILRKLEHRITSRAQPGTLIIAPYKMFDFRYREMGCAHIADRLYIAGVSQNAATALRRKAELIGPDPGLARPMVPSIWDPLLSASRRNGYGVQI